MSDFEKILDLALKTIICALKSIHLLCTKLKVTCFFHTLSVVVLWPYWCIPVYPDSAGSACGLCTFLEQCLG